MTPERGVRAYEMIAEQEWPKSRCQEQVYKSSRDLLRAKTFEHAHVEALVSVELGGGVNGREDECLL